MKNVSKKPNPENLAVVQTTLAQALRFRAWVFGCWRRRARALGPAVFETQGCEFLQTVDALCASTLPPSRSSNTIGEGSVPYKYH